MITLLVVIYISFIAVGLPDALLGVVWPAIYTEFSLPISVNGYISMVVSGCTVVASLFSAKLNYKFGTGVVTAVSTALTVVALFGLAFSSHIAFFFLLAIPLGLGAGAIDSGLNSFVALHYSTAQMNFLQCFYGIGVMVSPYLMSLALGNSGDWRKGYLIVAIIQAALLLVTVLALPLWKKTEKRVVAQTGAQTKLLSLKQMLQMPAVRWNCLVFCFCCGIELTFGGWCSTYFVNVKGLAVDLAAQITVLFYVGLSVGRFLSGLLAKRFTPRQMVIFSSCLLLCAIVLLVLPFGLYASAVALLLAGLGVGPLFPNLALLTPAYFGKDVAASVIGLQMSATYLGIMLMPPLFGLVAQYVGVWLFPAFMLVMHGIYLAALAAMLRCVGKAKNMG